MICTLQPCRRGLGGGAQNTKAPRSVLMQLSVWWLVGMAGLGVLLIDLSRSSWGPCLGPMESSEQSSQPEMVPVTLELPRDLVDWIDGLRIQMGFRNRGLIVAQLLRELIPETDVIEQQQQEPTDEV